MEIKKSRHNYGLELIPAPSEGTCLGDLVWDSALGGSVFAHAVMPNTINTVFINAELNDELEFETFKSELF